MYNNHGRYRIYSLEKFRPSQLRFTHDSIKTDFQDGHSMADTLTDLLNDNLNPEALKPLLVMEFKGRNYVVRGNRRLYLYRKMEEGGHMKEITVKKVPFEQETFNKMYTTDNDGVRIRLRGYKSHLIENQLNNIVTNHTYRRAAAARAEAEARAAAMRYEYYRPKPAPPPEPVQYVPRTRPMPDVSWSQPRHQPEEERSILGTIAHAIRSLWRRITN